MLSLDKKQIETERLLLTRFVVQDSEAYFKLIKSQKDIARYMTWEVHQSEEETKEYLTKQIVSYLKPYPYNYKIVLKETGNLIGRIHAFNFVAKYGSCEIGYCLAKEESRKGYMSEALTSFLHFLLEEAKVDYVYGKCMESNIASQKVMLHAGMKPVGRIEGYSYNTLTKKREAMLVFAIERGKKS